LFFILCHSHAQDYKQEMMDRYLSLEEGQGGDIEGIVLLADSLAVLNLSVLISIAIEILKFDFLFSVHDRVANQQSTFPDVPGLIWSLV
jgi:hypothetical protein